MSRVVLSSESRSSVIIEFSIEHPTFEWLPLEKCTELRTVHRSSIENWPVHNRIDLADSSRCPGAADKEIGRRQNRCSCHSCCRASLDLHTWSMASMFSARFRRKPYCPSDRNWRIFVPCWSIVWRLSAEKSLRHLRFSAENQRLEG